MFDGMSGDIRTIKLRSKKVDCPVCGMNPSIKKLIDYEIFCGSCATDKVCIIQHLLFLQLTMLSSSDLFSIFIQSLC